MKLIVGLGNPGKEYKNTRHNVGFRALDEIGLHFGVEDVKAKAEWKGKLAKGEIAGEKVILLKPQTFMNLSGESIQPVMHYFRLTHKDLIVIYDDFVIAPGTVRIRPSGSSGGHNGMESILHKLHTDQFTRVRIGIAPFNAWQGSNVDYVLGRLTPQEQEIIEPVLKKMPEIVEAIIRDGMDEAMQKFNGEGPQ